MTAIPKDVQSSLTDIRRNRVAVISPGMGFTQTQSLEKELFVVITLLS